MAKNFINETQGYIQAFEGFYESRWTPDEEIYRECEMEGLEEDVDFTFNYTEYKNDVCKKYTSVWEQMLQDYIHKDMELEFVGISSPRFYNYDTDHCDTIVKFTQEAKDAFIAKIRKHRDLIAGWIKEDFTSYSGFISFLENDIRQWNETRLFDDTKELHQPAYLYCMLHYVVKAELLAAGYNLHDYGFSCIDEHIQDDVLNYIYVYDYFEGMEEAA